MDNVVKIAQGTDSSESDGVDEENKLTKDAVAPTYIEIAVPAPEFVSVKLERADTSDEEFIDVDTETPSTSIEQNCVVTSTSKSGLCVSIKQESLSNADDEGKLTVSVDPANFASTIANGDTVKRKLQCYICNVACTDESGYQRHLLTHLNETIVCKFCTKPFKVQDLLEHIHTAHMNVLDYECKRSLTNRMIEGETPCEDHSTVTSTSEGVEMVVSVKQESVSEDEDDGSFTVPIDPANYVSIVSSDDIRERALKKKHQCYICNCVCPDEKNYQRHMLRHSHHTILCKFCTKPFPSHEILQQHVHAVHTNVKIYECDECNKIFKSSANLKQHQRVHLVVKPYKCEKCLRSFAVETALLKHQGRSRCKEPAEYKCCGKVYEKEFQYKLHMRMHSTEKPFQCHVCKMDFKYKSTLTRHVLLHDSTKHHACKVCGKMFTSRGLIKPHMRKHTGERPYTCPVCLKSFSHKQNMQRHSLRHEKPKQLVCEICFRAFPRESRLKYHMRTHVPNNKLFKCELCPKTFSHRQNIVRHYTRKHPKHTYGNSQTDASIAKEIWQRHISEKQAEKDYILPEPDSETETDSKDSVKKVVRNGGSDKKENDSILPDSDGESKIFIKQEV